MRIKRLYIADYKGLKEFEIYFDRPISVFVGENGVGKSTILEFLAMILVPLKNGELLLYKGDFEIEFNNGKIIKNGDMHIEKNMLPRIIGYYSGDNKELYNIFNRADQKLLKELANENTLGKYSFYFHPFYMEFLLIYLFMMRDYNPNIDIFLTELGIYELGNTIISFKKPDLNWAKKKKSYWGATGILASVLNVLESDSIEKIFNSEEDYSVLTLEPSFEIFLENDIFSGKDFGVLEAFDALYINGFIESISVQFNGLVMKNSQSLSEGERQKIITQGLEFYFGGKNTLFLMDEPDTYLHPKWQKEFLINICDQEKQHISILSSTLPMRLGDNRSQFFITTHSPLLIGSEDNNEIDIIGLKKYDDGKVFIHCHTNPVLFGNKARDIGLIDIYGNRAEFIYKEIFGLESTRANKFEEEIDKLHNILKSKSEGKKLTTEEDIEFSNLKQFLISRIGDDIDDLYLAYLSIDELSSLIKKKNEKNI